MKIDAGNDGQRAQWYLDDHVTGHGYVLLTHQTLEL